MNARYVMIGGFLGAGKTTTLARLAERYTARGLKVGLITNDQANDLVDTAVLRSRGYAVEEIAGGCFCCRFPSLQAAAERLDAETRPDLFLAEPVGSCTDLVATVSYPLRRIYGDRFGVAPLSVLLDPSRAARVLGLAEGRAFSPKVRYIYEKQLEEARFLVVNKKDAVDAALLERLVATIGERYPHAEVFTISALHDDGLDDWVARLDEAPPQQGPSMEVDYDLYADGEALLGWLNATLTVDASTPIDANDLVVSLADRLRERLAAQRVEIAHLKLTLDAGALAGELAAASVVSSDAPAELRERMPMAVDGGALVVNLRAEADPDALRDALVEVVASTPAGVTITLDHQESFRPARPVPTHRIAEA